MIPLRTSAARWGAAIRIVHWAMAVAIVAMLVLGVVMTAWPLSVTKIKLYAFHKALGITLLGLAIVRLAWRALDGRPDWPAGMAASERRAAATVHGLLYGLMIAMPFTGWLLNSAAGFPLSYFGLAEVPAIAADDERLQASAALAHLVLACVLGTLVAGHVAAALRHHLRARDGVLERMWF